MTSAEIALAALGLILVGLMMVLWAGALSVKVYRRGK